MFKQAAQQLFSLLFPSVCLGCNIETAELLLCARCEESLQFIAWQKQSEVHCLFEYRNALVKNLITSYKYDGIRDLGSIFAFHAARFLQIQQLAGNIVLPEEMIVTAVPLHHAKQRIRGFNQSALVAQAVAHRLGLQYAELLVKIKRTKSQAELGRQARLNNLRGVFKTSGNRSAAEISGKTILLIDDVFTTGATLNECKMTLLACGASSVELLAIAKD